MAEVGHRQVQASVGTVCKSKPSIHPRMRHKLKCATSFLLAGTFMILDTFKLSTWDQNIVESEVENFGFC